MAGLTQGEDTPHHGPARRLQGWTATAVGALCAVLPLYALYWVVAVVEPFTYRVSFLLLVLCLGFALHPARSSSRARITAVDMILIVATVAALGWPLLDRAAFPYRAATPLTVDRVLGCVAILLVLEATRRAIGWVLPAIAVAALVYAWIGPVLDLVGLGALAHRGYPPDRLVGILYMTLDGILGVALEVAVTYVILFAVYGAVLEASGAGRFFLDWTLAVLSGFRSGAGPGRAVALAGFLLGTVSGSGVATTLTLGAMAWPLLRRSGYPPEVAGGILSAAGIGAILSPPTLGAAAFLIAEFLEIGYIQVLVMATVPTLLYYLSILVVVEGDALRFHALPVTVETPPVGALTRRYGYHFASLAAIPALMAYGLTPFAAVLGATLLAAASSFLRPDTALTPPRAVTALVSAGRGVLGIAATTACAGIIVGVVALTGLGLKLAGLIVAIAGGNPLLTVACASVAIWMVGLALPVTASYIIAAVMIAPALVKVGLPAVAAHMFIFYYAVLSEVSPPTALAPFAAAGLTGGNPYRTMVHTWRYTLPAFVVPWVFALTPDGLGLLLQAPFVVVFRGVGVGVVGMTALSAAVGGRLLGVATPAERWAAAAGAVLVLTGRPWGLALGAVALAVTLTLHARGVRRLQTTRVAPDSTSARISSS